MNQRQSKVLFFVFLGLTLAFQNCSRIAISNIDGDTNDRQGTPEITPPANPPSVPNPVNPSPTEATLKTIQPALAVRAMSCVLCHAEIKSSVITDFGLGTADFMGGDNHFFSKNSWYNDLAGAWQSSHISGTVFVPAAPVTARAQSVLGSAYDNQPLLKIKDFMKIPYTTTGWEKYLSAKEAQSEMAWHIEPDVGNDSVVEKTNILIRAPSMSEIQALAPELWSASAPASGAKRIGSNEPLQLIPARSAAGIFLQNDENAVLECSKMDIVVRGTLFLRRLKIHAAGGCRLYVSGSVFIEEGITYVGNGDLQNLQITSSSAILMGLSPSRLKTRLVDRRDGLNLVARDYSNLATQVLQEADLIGDLKDAQDDYAVRASYDFTGLLLNAPIVHSRYLGKVQGTIISEAILFALGEFHFVFDPVFTKVNVLPLLTNSILKVQ